MTRDGKNFLQMASVSAIIVVLFYMIGGGEPASLKYAAASGMEGVEKALASGKDTTISNENAGSLVDYLISNDAFRRLIQQDNFQSLMKSPGFSEISSNKQFWKFINDLQSSDPDPSPYLELKGDPTFQTVVESQEFQELRNDQVFVSLMNDPSFLEIVQSQGLNKLMESLGD